jgi:hypothetical protein
LSFVVVVADVRDTEQYGLKYGISRHLKHVGKKPLSGYVLTLPMFKEDNHQ